MVNILVVTPDISFGELIRQKLEEMGRFRVRVIGEMKSAVSVIKKEECPLVFLDTELGEQEIHKIGEEAHRHNPDVHIVLITEDGQQPEVIEFTPDGILSRPFSSPDLVRMMENIYPIPKSLDNTQVEAQNNAPTWLSDITRAAQYLTRLTLGSSAQAALITRDDQLWSYAGQLPQSATRELTETVTRYWNRQEEGDLVRFVRLNSTEAEHMLYATRLTRNMVLAMIFDAETPFSTIRTQASRLAHSLSTPPSDGQNTLEDIEDDTPTASISSILTDIPSPNPELNSLRNPDAPAREAHPAFSLPSTAPLQFQQPVSPSAAVDQIEETPVDEPVVDLEQTIESLAVTRKSRTRRNEPDPNDMGETRPGANEQARKIVLEPVSPSVYNLDYACLLVPRFTHHHLIGDLSDELSEWVPNICIAFGWRLEYISVRPEHLLWIVNVPPATSPGYLMRMLRQHTSERVFSEFPRYKKENPSGDFWAPGYLILGGSQPPPAQLIKDFIAQTRQRQGISQPSR
jgi:REP element-mobilizing transposase RayT/DNA-binding NarL/FixJ family response regulator